MSTCSSWKWVGEVQRKRTTNSLDIHVTHTRMLKWKKSLTNRVGGGLFTQTQTQTKTIVCFITEEGGQGEKTDEYRMSVSLTTAHVVVAVLCEGGWENLLKYQLLLLLVFNSVFQNMSSTKPFINEEEEKRWRGGGGWGWGWEFKSC